jgi:hypothetical protein
MMQRIALWLPNGQKDIGVLWGKTVAVITTWCFEGMQSHNPQLPNVGLSYIRQLRRMKMGQMAKSTKYFELFGGATLAPSG